MAETIAYSGTEVLSNDKRALSIQRVLSLTAYLGWTTTFCSQLSTVANEDRQKGEIYQRDQVLWPYNQSN